MKRPQANPSPSLVEIGVKQESASGVVTVTNKGLAAAQEAVKASLLTPTGGTPPNWVRLA